mgnify:CR=1 FL=1
MNLLPQTQCIVGAWLRHYNLHAVHLIATLLAIARDCPTHEKCVVLMTAIGHYRRTVSIDPTTCVADVASGDRMYVSGLLATPLNPASKLWNLVEDGAELVVVPFRFQGVGLGKFSIHSTAIYCIVWNSKGTQFVSMTRQCSKLHSWNTVTGKHVVLRTLNIARRFGAWSPTDTHFASGWNTWSVRIFDTTTWQCTQILTGHTSCVNALSWHPNRTLIASASDDQTVRIWDVTSPIPTRPIRLQHTCAVDRISWHPTKNWIACASSDAQIHVWDVTRQTRVNTFCAKTWTTALCWNPSGTYLTNGSANASIRIWSLTSHGATCICTLKGHTEWINDICWHPSGTMIATSMDFAVRIWTISPTFNVVNTRTLYNEYGSCNTLSWHPHGNYLFGGSVRGFLHIWK